MAGVRLRAVQRKGIGAESPRSVPSTNVQTCEAVRVQGRGWVVGGESAQKTQVRGSAPEGWRVKDDLFSATRHKVAVQNQRDVADGVSIRVARAQAPLTRSPKPARKSIWAQCFPATRRDIGARFASSVRSQVKLVSRPVPHGLSVSSGSRLPACSLIAFQPYEGEPYCATGEIKAKT